VVRARGLLNRLLTRIYFPGEPLNMHDSVLNAVPPTRRPTLIATACAPSPETTLRFDIVLQPPLPPAAVRYAQLTLHRAQENLDGKLDAGDFAELGVIAAGIPDRDDLTVRTSRTVWLARRPAA